MEKSIFNIIIGLICFNSVAQSPDMEWQKTFGGTNHEMATCILKTSDDGYIIAGNTISDDGDITENQGTVDVWVVKLDTAGTIVWQKTYGGTLMDSVYSMIQTSDGGYVFAGSTQSNNGDVTGNHNSGYDDFWIVKLTATGAIVWQKTLGGTNHDVANSIQQTSDGGYIVAGSTESNNGDVTGIHSTFKDCWIVKLNDIGEIIWQKTLGGYQDDFANTAHQTADGGYIVAGLAGSYEGNVTGQHGTFDCWVIKLNSNGEIIWQKALGGTGHDSARDILQTSDGGYLLVGNAASNDGDVSGNHGDMDIWIVKLTATGAIVWQKTLGGTGTEYIESIKQISGGQYILAGYTYSNDGDVSGNHTTDNSYADFWVVKLNATGGIVWQKTLGGTNFDSARDIQQTSDNGYIVAGSTSSEDGDVTGLHGNGDCWVIKLAPDTLSPIYTRIENSTVYPNPSKNHIIIQNEEYSTERFNFRILDLNGRIVTAGSSNFNEKINTEHLKSGNYIIQMEAKNGTIVNKKLTKN